MTRFASVLACGCALSYLGTGVFYLLDPSSDFPRGSPEYWQALADAPVERSAFLFCFGAAALFALGIIPSIMRLVRLRPGEPGHWGCILGFLGYGMTAVTYFRLFSGEPQRAAAVAQGSDDVQQAILSFSLSPDTQGWFIFGCVGLFLASVNATALWRKRFPWPVAILGLLAAGLYWLAFAGLLLRDDDLVALAAGIGGIAVGPLWWLCIAGLFWKRAPSRPVDQKG